jgi:2-polyprenyl-3-methyl-5-hydroxy-6-metoxy-1,4-benzoquinol methylase
MTGFDGSPSADAWPAGGLEPVVQCPVCGSESRTLLYEGLRDLIFFCAPGEWRLFRCTHCGSGYLDPRPSRKTIHLAYRNYFTHSAGDEVRPSVDRPFARIFANGYRNWRYGTRDRPSSWLGVLVKALQPRRRAQIDAEMRHLEKPRPGAALLDVGCGNGVFLERARDIGWRVLGVEPDPRAAAVARSQGLDVHLGGIEILDEISGEFDLITMSHVIEHVHDPISLLRACRRLLRSGGRIWIETPNLDSIGHSIYGASWRGLEPPRHLVLFTYLSLRRAVHQAEFNCVTDKAYRNVCGEVFAASEAIAAARNPMNSSNLAASSFKPVMWRNIQEWANPGIREFITLSAMKG